VVAREELTGEGWTTCQFGVADEVVHEPGDHPSHNESPYFNFIPEPDSPIAGVIVRIGLRPNDGYSEASLVIPRRDGGTVFHYARTPLARADVPVGAARFESGAMALEAVVPTRRWTIGYVGDDARWVTDTRLFGESPGEAWRASRPVRCALSLDWEADFPIHVLSADGHELPEQTDLAYGKAHYEQFGMVNGTLRIGDEAWELSGVPSFRDHSWGARVWERHPDQDFLSAYLDDGRRVVLIANREDGGKSFHGVIWKPGADAPIEIERYELHTDYDGGATAPREIGFEIAGGGESISIDGTVSGFMPLRVGKSATRLGQITLTFPGGRAKTDLTRPLPGSA
jgi:hypothetical protein